MRSSKLLIAAISLLWALPANAASCFWVGGTGNTTDTTHWASASGGTAGTCAGTGGIPGATDTATWDTNSGGGVVTVNNPSPWSLTSMTMGAFAGTWDNSVNNININLSGLGNAWSGTGSAVRTYNLGTATYTLSGATGSITFATATNLTMNGSAATFAFTGNGARTYTSGGAFTIGTLTISASGSTGFWKYLVGSGSGTIFTNTTITAPNYIIISAATTFITTNPVNWIGSNSAQIGFVSDTANSTASISIGTGSTIQWGAFRDIAFTGSPSITNSFDLLHNTGATITGPSSGGGGGGGHIIGG